MLKKAKCFKISSDHNNIGAIVTPGGFHYHPKDFDKKNDILMHMWEHDTYPLLIQTTIECINREKIGHIQQYVDYIGVGVYQGSGHSYPINGNIIEAKELAIIYILKHEIKMEQKKGGK